jgi:hypothetical protein
MKHFIIFDPDTYRFTHRKTGKVIHGSSRTSRRNPR